MKSHSLQFIYYWYLILFCVIYCVIIIFNSQKKIITDWNEPIALDTEQSFCHTPMTQFSRRTRKRWRHRTVEGASVHQFMLKIHAYIFNLTPFLLCFLWSLPYHWIYGGITALSKEQFMKINGFPTMYWGWGGEDDDISHRSVLLIVILTWDFLHYLLRFDLFTENIVQKHSSHTFNHMNISLCNITYYCDEL